MAAGPREAGTGVEDAALGTARPAKVPVTLAEGVNEDTEPPIDEESWEMRLLTVGPDVEAIGVAFAPATGLECAPGFGTTVLVTGDCADRNACALAVLTPAFSSSA